MGSDEIEGNTTLIVKENKENEKIVEIENIFDEDIDADSKDVTLIENLSIKDIIVDDKTNESVSDANVDESVEKDLSQDIDNKHQIVREEITVAASDDLNCSTTESVLNTTSEEDIVTTLDNNYILQGNILCQDSTKLRLAAYMDDNLTGSNELCCISLLRASDDADVGVIIPVDPFEISPSDVTKVVEIENIFDEDIDADSKDVTLVENLSIKDIIVDEKSNESVSVTNVDESVEKDLSQDIDNKHQIVREEITVPASDDLNCSTTESVLNTTSEEDIVTKLDNNYILQGNILCQDSTKL